MGNRVQSLLSLDVFSSSSSRHKRLRLLFGNDGKVVGFRQGLSSGSMSSTVESSGNLPLLRSRLHNFKASRGSPQQLFDKASRHDRQGSDGQQCWSSTLLGKILLLSGFAARRQTATFHSNLLGDGHGDETANGETFTPPASTAAASRFFGRQQLCWDLLLSISLCTPAMVVIFKQLSPL